MLTTHFFSTVIIYSLFFIFTFPVSYSFSGDKNTIIIAKPFGPSVRTPDPAKGSNGWYTSEAGVTETLFSLDFDMKIQPKLVKTYKCISPLIWQITLRDGIRFHDNTPLDTAAVKWSLERLVDKQSPTFNIRLKSMLDLKNISIIDNLTMTFETNKPNAPFLYNLTSPAAAIISPTSNSNTIFGTGPFILNKVIPKEKMLVSRFEKYWNNKAQIPRAELHIIRNPSTRMLAFESGQLDVVTNYPENDVNRMKSRKNIKIYSQPTNRLCFFFVRVADGPFAKPKIREAINYAIDRQMIVNAILGEIGGKVGGSIFPDGLPWHNKHLPPYAYDPDKALSLLKQAGAKDDNNDGLLDLDGKPLILNMWSYEGRASLKPILEMIQDQLLTVGIGTKIRITKTGSPINNAMKRGDVHLNLQMWNVAPEGDPDFFISNVFVGGAGSNFMGYQNKNLDELAFKGKTTFEYAARKNIYDHIQEIIYRDSPVIVLFHKSMVTLTKADVKNFQMHPSEKYLLTHELAR